MLKLHKLLGAVLPYLLDHWTVKTNLTVIQQHAFNMCFKGVIVFDMVRNAVCRLTVMTCIVQLSFSIHDTVAAM